MGPGFRQMLQNVSCHNWGRETKPKDRDSVTRDDRNVVRQHIGPRQIGTEIL